MRKYFDFVEGTDGRAVRGASVRVTTYPADVLATLYADSGAVTPLANPLTTDGAGYYEFYIADGHYTIRVDGSGLAEQVVQDVVIYDPTNVLSGLAAAQDAATAAAASAGSASTSASTAQKWATQTSAEVVTGQGYGAKKYSQDAATSAGTASAQAGVATTKATEAAASASAALANGKIYASTSAAQADGTLANNSYYAVPQASPSSTFYDLYQKVSSSSSTYINSFPSTALVSAMRTKQTTERVSPETTLRNIFTNGDFSQGLTGYGGNVTYTLNASGGANLKVGSLSTRFFDGPTLSYTYTAGNRFLLVYNFDWVNHVDANIILYLENTSNAGITPNVNIPWVSGTTSYSGSAIVTINSGQSGSQLRVSGEFDSVTTNNEIWMKYAMLIPLDGALTGYTQAQVLAEIAARGMTGRYFEPGGASLLSILARRADVATTVDDAAITLAKLETAMQDNGFVNLVTKPDLKQGQQGWTNGSSAATVTFGAGGAHFDATPAGTGTAVQCTIISPTNMTLQAGHRYAFYVDMDLLGDGQTSTLKYGTFKPTVNNTTGITYASKLLEIGQSGVAKNQKAVTIFDVPGGGAGSPLQAYFTFGAPFKDASIQNVLTFDLDVDLRTCMLVDLGVSGDVSYSLGEADLAEVISRLGAPYYPTAPAKTKRVVDAVRSVYSKHAELADTATLAATATLAEAVRSPWEGKRMGTFGHSLVSQAGWQGNTYNYLNLGGYNYLGIAGGRVQPTAGNSSQPGFFSRAYWANAVANAVGVNRGAASSTGLSGQTMDAVVLWAGANDGIKNYGSGNKLLLDHAQVISVLGSTVANASGGDRMMTTAEQNEYEAAVYASSSADLSAPLSTGLVPTYKTLWFTMFKNMLEALAPYVKVDSTRFFIVREPQNFQIYDGTLDWDKGHYEKNEIHRQVADALGVPLINLFGEGIGFWNRTVFLQNEDGGNLWVHQNQKGGLLHGRRIAQVMLQYPPLDYTGLFGASTFQIPTAQADQSPWIVDNL